MEPVPEADIDIHEWTAWASWTFCPECGRRRANGKIASEWWKQGAKAVAVKCIKGCDLHPQDLSREQACREDKAEADENDQDPVEASEKPTGPLRAYITPSNIRAAKTDDAGACGYGATGQHQWSTMYQADKDPAKGDWPACILHLTEADARELAIVTLKVQHAHVRGGNAPTHNIKKTGVVTAHWRREDVEAKLTSPSTRAALAWLMTYNSTYQTYIEMHRRELAAMNKPNGWFVIKKRHSFYSRCQGSKSQHDLGFILSLSTGTVI